MPPLKDNSEDYRIERPNRHIIHEANQFEYEDFSRNCALLRCKISKINETALVAQNRANEVHEADAEVINIKAELDYTTHRHKIEKEEMLASFHRALEVESNKMIKVKDQHKEDMENETKKMIKLKDQHEDECNKNKMRVHDLFYRIKCNTGADKAVVDLKGNRGLTEESYFQLIQKEFSDAGAKIQLIKKEFSDAGAKIKDLKMQLHNAEKKHSIEKQDLKIKKITDLSSAEKKHSIEKQELKTQQNNAEKKHLLEKQELLNSTEKKHLVETQELNKKLEQNSLEAEAIVMKLKAALEFTIKMKDTKIEELKDAFEKEKNEITNICNAEKKEKNAIIESYNAEKKEKNELFISYTEMKALQSKNRDRKKIVSFQTSRFFGS